MGSQWSVGCSSPRHQVDMKYPKNRSKEIEGIPIGHLLPGGQSSESVSGVLGKSGFTRVRKPLTKEHTSLDQPIWIVRVRDTKIAPETTIRGTLLKNPCNRPHGHDDYGDFDVLKCPILSYFLILFSFSNYSGKTNRL